MRRAEIAGAFAMVLNKGDPDGGAALVCVRQGNEALMLYRAARNAQGGRIWWSKPLGGDLEAKAYIDKSLVSDPDLWVIEIEDREGRHFLLDPIEAS